MAQSTFPPMSNVIGENINLIVIHSHKSKILDVINASIEEIMMPLSLNVELNLSRRGSSRQNHEEQTAAMALLFK